jgi:hypothetical protein
MNRIESLLSAAAKDEAAEVTPESIPTLAEAGLSAPRRPRLRSRLLRGPVAPLLAAAAVVAVIAAALALSSVLPGAGRTNSPAVTQPTLAAGAIPPYYAALTATGAPATSHPLTLTVRSTVSGKALATPATPTGFGTFSLVDGTANPTTFLVGAQPWRPVPVAKNSKQVVNSTQPVTLFWLRYDPATHAARLTRLPLAAFAGTGLLSVSVSPDRSRVAVAYQDTSKGVDLRNWITVYSLPGGAARTWSAPGSFSLHGMPQPTNQIGTLSWRADDRTLAYQLTAEHSGVYLLNTADAGTRELLAASRRAVPLDNQDTNDHFVCDGNPLLTPDGADVLCGGYTVPPGWSIESKGFPRVPVTQGFGEFSVATGKLVTILGAIRAPLSLAGGQPNPYNQQVTDDVFPFLLWASADARVAIGLTDGGHAVVVRDGRVKRIAWPVSIAIPYDSNVPGVAW